ncbi:hypothetical protein MFUR16E_04435 [Methylobacterium fujisawaense]|uniref:helix-turn-helix domain-containing protein n=1 Tax=Methylobacterium fujisawaense TaxID=107400 RepID=UPI002F2CFE87
MLARTDQSAPMRQYLDRIEELEEQVRQLKDAFAPKVSFPLGWELDEQNIAVLSALFHTKGSYVTAEALRFLLVGFDDNASTKFVEHAVSRLRRKLEPHDVRIHTRLHQGYALVPASRVRVAEALGQLPAKSGGRIHPRTWSDAEDAIIRAGYGREAQLSVIRLELIGAGFIARSVSSISERAQMLGLTHDRRAAGWTEDEDAILRGGYAASVGPVAIRRALARAGFSRTRAAIQCRARDLSICAPAPVRWSDEQIALLKRRCAENVPHRRIAHELGRPVSSIQDKVSDLGLLRRRPWTAEEKQRLIDGLAAREDGLTIAAALKRPAPQIFAMAHRMGLSFSRGRPA